MMLKQLTLATLFMLSLIIVPVALCKESPVTVVDDVDINQYTGTWHEIASIPMFFQRKCVKNTKAVYSLNDNGTIKVDNSCETESGKRIQSIGNAKIVDTETNAKLKVSFVNWFGWWIYAFGGDYWIIDLDKDDYTYAVVGHPTRKYGWILSKTPKLGTDTLLKISNSLTKQGYNTCQFNLSVQTEGLQNKMPLCEWVKQQD